MMHYIRYSRIFILTMENTNLTLEQQFQMKLVEDSVERMNPQQMKEMIVQLSQIIMMKDNAVRAMARSEMFPA
jgi:Phycobilisome degradation protein nblA